MAEPTTPVDASSAPRPKSDEARAQPDAPSGQPAAHPEAPNAQPASHPEAPSRNPPRRRHHRALLRLARSALAAVGEHLAPGRNVFG